MKLSAVFVFYILTTSLLFLTIFVLNVFPDCFIEGTGLTTFKIAGEYIICAILLLAFAILFKSRAFLDDHVVKLVLASIIFTILSELSFTLYTDLYGLANMVGHYLKVVSFYLIYKAIIERGLAQPFTMIFRELKRNEDRYGNQKKSSRRYLIPYRR